MPPLAPEDVRDIMLGHLQNLYLFYGEQQGVRVARKHIGWYCRGHTGAEKYRRGVVRVDSAKEQIEMTRRFFGSLARRGERAA